MEKKREGKSRKQETQTGPNPSVGPARDLPHFSPLSATATPCITVKNSAPPCVRRPAASQPLPTTAPVSPRHQGTSRSSNSDPGLCSCWNHSGPLLVCSRSTVQFHDTGDSRTFLTPVAPPQDLHGLSRRISRLGAIPLRLRPCTSALPHCWHCCASSPSNSVHGEHRLNLLPLLR